MNPAPLPLKRIVMIVGLPGSGKTHYGRRLAEENDYTLIDDPDDFAEVERVLYSSDKGVVVTDPRLCWTDYRKLAEEELIRLDPAISIEWVFFANDPEQCLENCYTRADGRKVDKFIEYASMNYVIPPSAFVRPVYKPE